MSTVMEDADYVRRLEAQVKHLESDHLAAVRRARLAEESEKALSVELAKAQATARKASTALEKAVWFIENVTQENPQRTEFYFEARALWSQVLGTLDGDKGRERVIRMLAVRWRKRFHDEGVGASMDTTIANALREYAAEDLVQFVPRAVLIEVLDECLQYFNRLPNKALPSTSMHKNTYGLAGAIEGLLKTHEAMKAPVVING